MRILFKYKEYKLEINGFWVGFNNNLEKEYINWVKEIKKLEKEMQE